MAKGAHEKTLSDCSCPRCNYNVSGEVSRWNSDTSQELSCPLFGTCPECGLQFEWKYLLRSGLACPPWFFETAIERGRRRWSAFRTVLRAATPWIFWKDVRLETPHAVHRTIIWFIMMVPGAGALVLAMTAGIAVAMWIVHAVQNPAQRGNYAERMISDFLDVMTATATSLFVPASGSTWVSTFLVGAVSYPLMLLVLPDSRRIAKVRWEHLLRASTYALAIWPIFWLGGLALLIASMAVMELLPKGASVAGSFVFVLNPLLEVWGSRYESSYFYFAVMIWYAVWWALALSRGFRMKRAWLVWLSVVIPSLLLQCGALLARDDFQFPAFIVRIFPWLR